MYYDVIDMDACQLVFGRPWQFDLDAQHAGKENVYRLEKDRVKFTFTSQDSKTGGHTFFTIIHLEQEMGAAVKESRVVHALIVKQVLTVWEEQKSLEHPAAVKALLEEFQRVMPEELPDGLPPIRDIQHHIDLILSASLPNLPHYKMSPKESEILKEKVDELLQKGYI